MPVGQHRHGGREQGRTGGDQGDLGLEQQRNGQWR
jgi:hypothetical protein